MSRRAAPTDRRRARQRGASRHGIVLRIAIVVVAVLVVGGGVFAYTTIARQEVNPDRQAAWAGNTATAAAVGPDGTLYLAFLREIYQIDLSSGTVTLIAGRASDPGSHQPAPTADGQPAVGAAIRPTALAVGPQGQVYFADQLSQTIRTIQGGDLKSIGRAQQVGGVAVDEASGTVYFADQGKNQIYGVDPTTGKVSTIAGNGQPGFAGDGKAGADAEFTSPDGLAVLSGNLLIADSGNDRIREVNLQSRVVSTVAGSGKSGFSGDGGPATQAELDDPVAVAADPDGGFVIADQGNHRLRDVNAAGVISTLAGTGLPGIDDPGSSIGATSAHLRAPSSLVYVGEDLYFVDDFQVRLLAGGQISYYTPPGNPT